MNNIKYYMIAAEKYLIDGNVKTVRLLKLNSTGNREVIKTIDLFEYEVIHAIHNGEFTVENLEVRDNKLVGSNGNIERYTQHRLVILNAMVDDKENVVGYRIADANGKVLKLSVRDTLRAVKYYGIANGKVVKKDNNYFISSIKGEYPRIDAVVTREVHDYRKRARDLKTSENIHSFIEGVSNAINNINKKAGKTVIKGVDRTTEDSYTIQFAPVKGRANTLVFSLEESAIEHPIKNNIISILKELPHSCKESLPNNASNLGDEERKIMITRSLIIKIKDNLGLSKEIAGLTDLYCVPCVYRNKSELNTPQNLDKNALYGLKKNGEAFVALLVSALAETNKFVASDSKVKFSDLMKSEELLIKICSEFGSNDENEVELRGSAIYLLFNFFPNRVEFFRPYEESKDMYKAFNYMAYKWLNRDNFK